MRRYVLVLVAMLAIVLSVPKQAFSQPEETICFTVGGESAHGVVWLDGSGTKQGDQLTYVQARPIIAWAGGVQSPAAFRVTFRIDGRPGGTVDVGVNDRSRHSSAEGERSNHPGMGRAAGDHSVDLWQSRWIATGLSVTAPLSRMKEGQCPYLHWPCFPTSTSTDRPGSARVPACRRPPQPTPPPRCSSYWYSHHTCRSGPHGPGSSQCPPQRSGSPPGTPHTAR
jgi:hypothetical protein